MNEKRSGSLPPQLKNCIKLDNINIKHLWAESKDIIAYPLRFRVLIVFGKNREQIMPRVNVSLRVCYNNKLDFVLVILGLVVVTYLRQVMPPTARSLGYVLCRLSSAI